MNLQEHFATYRGAVKDDMLCGFIDFVGREPSPNSNHHNKAEYLSFLISLCDSYAKKNDSNSYKHYLEIHQKEIIELSKKLFDIEFGGIKDPEEKLHKILESKDHNLVKDGVKWWKFSDCVVRFKNGGYLIPRYSLDFDCVKSLSVPLVSVHEQLVMTGVYKLGQDDFDKVLEHKRNNTQQLKVFKSVRPDGGIEMCNAREANKGIMFDWMMRLFP